MRNSDITLARQLFCEGFAIVEIARQLGVTPSTVYRWKKQAAAAQCGWDRGRGMWQRAQAEELLDLLVQRRDELLEVKDDSDLKWRTVSAYCRLIKKAREELSRDRSISVYRDFLRWVRKYRSGKEEEAIERGLSRFVEEEVVPLARERAARQAAVEIFGRRGRKPGQGAGRGTSSSKETGSGGAP